MNPNSIKKSTTTNKSKPTTAKELLKQWAAFRRHERKYINNLFEYTFDLKDNLSRDQIDFWVKNVENMIKSLKKKIDVMEVQLPKILHEIQLKAKNELINEAKLTKMIQNFRIREIRFNVALEKGLAEKREEIYAELEQIKQNAPKVVANPEKAKLQAQRISNLLENYQASKERCSLFALKQEMINEFKKEKEQKIDSEKCTNGPKTDQVKQEIISPVRE